MSKTIDARGQACPIPVVLAKKEIDRGLGEFSVRVDHSPAVENLQRLADSQGYRTTVESSEGSFHVTFTKAPDGDGIAADNLLEAACCKTGNWSVFVPREVIGDGDPTLGHSLMKMFFYTLTQADELPASILFMNAGVKLPALDAQIAEHLQVLVNRGVEVLVCGTCLNFYKLNDQLKIGVASNLYDILERMKHADKVITL